MIKFNFSKLATEFETETCSRCGGSGHYSYCQRYGTTCFKCGGGKRYHTKRGRVAYNLYESLLSKPASELRPGMKIRETIMTGMDQFSRGWFQIESIGPDTTRYGHIKDGVEVWETNPNLLRIETKHCSFAGVGPDHIYRVAATRGQKIVAKRKALALQVRLPKNPKREVA